MQASSYFLSKVKQAQKHKRSHPDFDLEQSIADYFVKIVDLPEPMARELYDTHAESTERMASVIDFFHMTLPIEQSADLTDAHWQEIVELINRYAQKHEIAYLQEMMQYLLDIDQLL